jgi:hypothetical protein
VTGKPGENPVRSRHCEVDLGIGMSDFGLFYIRNPKSQFPNRKVRIPAWNLLPAEMFRVKTFEADTAISNALFFLSIVRRERRGVFDCGLGNAV